MVYIPSVECADGEHFIHWFEPPITTGCTKVYWHTVLRKLPLLEYIDQKYWEGPLFLIWSFNYKVKRTHQAEIGAILDGFDEGDIR